MSQRTSEMGIRMALGAKPADVFCLVINEAPLLVGSGVVLGLIGALSLGRLVSNLLLGVSVTHPGTFVATLILLTIVALIASLVPARRATGTDPLVALRVE